MNEISYYTVVHYLPNPLSGERINVGLIAWGGGQVSARFLDDWRRVQSFGGEDIEFVRDFARRVEQETETQPAVAGLTDATQMNADRLKSIVGSWMHSIQFSDPRTSLRPPGQVVSEMAPIFLRSPHPRINRPRDRRQAAALAAESISTSVFAFAKRAPRNIVKRNQTLSGKLTTHAFDVVVGNGKPFFAAQGLSFEIADTRLLSLESDSTAFAIGDVRSHMKNFPVGILTLPPVGTSQVFQRAQTLFEELGAEVFESETAMEKWARKVARQTPLAELA